MEESEWREANRANWDEAALPDGMPGYYGPYLGGLPVVMDDPSDYLDRNVRWLSLAFSLWATRG